MRFKIDKILAVPLVKICNWVQCLKCGYFGTDPDDNEIIDDMPVGWNYLQCDLIGYRVEVEMHVTSSQSTGFPRPMTLCELELIGVKGEKQFFSIHLFLGLIWFKIVQVYVNHSLLFVPTPLEGGGTIYSNGFFFVQSILADRYIHRREFRLVSLESLSSVEYGIKNYIFIFDFDREISRFKLSRK